MGRVVEGGDEMLVEVAGEGEGREGVVVGGGRVGEVGEGGVDVGEGEGEGGEVWQCWGESGMEEA
uniref:hypothetical protein n=1 Tax=Rhodococcus hoagii TaxID=43767 RepID=UPI001C92F891